MVIWKNSLIFTTQNQPMIILKSFLYSLGIFILAIIYIEAVMTLIAFASGQVNVFNQFQTDFINVYPVTIFLFIIIWVMFWQLFKHDLI